MKLSHVAVSASLFVTPPAQAHPDRPPIAYACEDGTRLAAAFRSSVEDLGSVTIWISGRRKPMRLPQIPSADGGRYSAGRTLFWIKGTNATLARGSVVTACRMH